MKKQKMRMLRLAGVTAVVLSAGLWMLIPAWGAAPPAKQMAGMGGTGTGNSVLTKIGVSSRTAAAREAARLGIAL